MKIKAFIARDKGNGLYLYFTESIKDIFKEPLYSEWHTSLPKESYKEISSDLFPQIKWEDKFPTEVELTINIK